MEAGAWRCVQVQLLHAQAVTCLYATSKYMMVRKHSKESGWKLVRGEVFRYVVHQLMMARVITCLNGASKYMITCKLYAKSSIGGYSILRSVGGMLP